jgi:outer membrane receptor for ferrienterochelin and colicins
MRLSSYLVGPAVALAAVFGCPAEARAAADVPDEPPPASGEAVERPEERRVASVTQTLAEDSGVSVQTVCTNCNNADLSLGGLGNEHIAMVCDGIPVPPGLAQVYLLSILPPTLIDKVSVTRGPGEAELEGSAVGGGIEIERRRPEPGLALNLSADTGDYDWNARRADVSGRRGRFGGSIVASIAESDAIDSNGFFVKNGERVSDDSNELPEFDRDTVEASLDVDLTPSDRLRFGAVTYDESQEGGHAAPITGFDTTTFEFGFLGYGKEFVELERTQYAASYERSFGSGARLVAESLFADRSQDIEEIQSLNGPRQPTFFIDEQHTQGSVAWDQPAGHRTTLHFGASTSRRAFDVLQWNYTSFPPRPVPTSEAAEERGIFVSAERALGGSVELDTGLRWVDVDTDDDERRPYMQNAPLPSGSRVLPRAALTWKPADPLQLRFSLGAGFRAPQPIHEEVCCGKQYRSNRGLTTEKSWAAGIESVFQPSPRFKLAGSGYVVDFEDLVVKMVSVSYSLVPTVQNVNVHDARYVTLGAETRFDVTRWLALKGAASWLDAENKTGRDRIVALVDVPGALVPVTFTTDRIPYVVEKRGAIGLSLAPTGSDLTLDVSAQYAGDMLIQRFDNDVPDPTFTRIGDHIEFVETDDYWVVNLAGSIDLPSGFTIFAGIDNVGDYVQDDLGDPHFEYDWGPLRGRYLYGGLRYAFATERGESR